MTAAPLFCWSPEFLAYDFGSAHPMSPARLLLTHELIDTLGLLNEFEVREVEPATVDQLLLVHTPAYLEAVQRTANDDASAAEFGLGDEDNPVFGSMHASAARIVGASCAAVLAVWRGETRRALNLAGGMHHAMAARASGFCVYNDVSVGIAAALAEGARRVAYVDLDAHHGDGVERAFWDDDRVLTISIHQHPGSLFPGTGYAQDVGSGRARGLAVNLPLPAGTDGAGWLRAVDAVVPPLVEEFAPELVVSQHGCDAHRRDPLAGLEVSVEAQLAAAQLVASLADEHASGRWVALGGGGYDVAGVVPRVWAGLAAIVAGRGVPEDPALPAGWVEWASEVVGSAVPESLTDGEPADFSPWSAGFDPEDAVDRAVMATRQAVFPSHGLDPLTR